MERHVNVMSTVEIHSVTAASWHQKRMKTNIFRGCSHECRVHPRNRYVLEHELTQDQVIERLAAIGESLDHSEVV